MPLARLLCPVQSIACRRPSCRANGCSNLSVVSPPGRTGESYGAGSSAGVLPMAMPICYRHAKLDYAYRTLFRWMRPEIAPISMPMQPAAPISVGMPISPAKACPRTKFVLSCRIIPPQVCSIVSNAQRK